MKTKLILVASIALLLCCRKAAIQPTLAFGCSYTDSSATHPKHAIYNEIIQRYLKKGLPGITALLRDSSGAWIGAGGYADIEGGVKFTPCHLSKAASITKLMVGTLTFKLQEEGKININDPISKYIDVDILKKIDKAEGKTIKDLMGHTTGIFDVITSTKFYLAVINNPNKQWSQTDLLEYVYGEKGEELGNPYLASYSNTNTTLLTMCIEKAMGVKHEILLREKILDPLGMTNTFYQGRETIPTTAAQGYFDLHNNGTIVKMSNFITGSGNGYGGMFSNVFDLDRFITSLFVNESILSDSSLIIMKQVVKDDVDGGLGIGITQKFTVKPFYAIGHSGRDLGYSADMFWFPQKNCTLIFFVNYGTNGSSSLKQVFLDFESELTDALLK
jgi:D-alanyl-D-alanine carboxypeptidase